MKESIFRKESLEKINSPGQLNRYIRVAEPGMWIVLAAVLVLLLGVVIWGIFGTVESIVPAIVTAEHGSVVCRVDETDAQQVQPGMEVRIGKTSGSIVSGIEAGSFAAEFDSLEDGTYEAGVIVEEIAPISFVIQ